MASDTAVSPADRLFLDWLLQNGASFPKISWPSNATDSGSRGAIALEDIASGEAMVEIPARLMISPPAAFADPDIGRELHACTDVLRGDLLLCVYLMHELRKEKLSFYYPFLHIIPQPWNACEWSELELLRLQDVGMQLQAKNRRHMMKVSFSSNGIIVPHYQLIESPIVITAQTMYTRSVVVVNGRYPTAFPLEEFTFERFKFSWMTIQARAFGRRLPWTALVPFADCLNHSNVQTKYDFNISNNQMFRLFPSGSNCYPRGAEVYNSYGRRPNDNLLLDYGFAMLDNEWDDVEFCLSIDDDDPHFALRRRALFLVTMQSNKRFRCSMWEIPLQALTFLRIKVMDTEQLHSIVDLLDSASRAHRQQFLQKREVVTALANSRVPEQAAEKESEVRSVTVEDLLHPSVGRTATMHVSETESTTSHSAGIAGSQLESLRKESVIGKSPIISGQATSFALQEREATRMEALKWFDRPTSAELEVRALNALRDAFLSVLSSHPTSIAEDKELLQTLSMRRASNADEAVPVGRSALLDNNPQIVIPLHDDKTACSDVSDAVSTVVADSEEQKLAVAKERSIYAELQRISTIEFDSDDFWKTTSALNYRLTRKHIIARNIAVLDEMLSYFEELSNGISDQVEFCNAWEHCVPLLPSIAQIEAALGNSPAEVEGCSRGLKKTLYSKNYLPRLREYIDAASHPQLWPLIPEVISDR